MSVILDPDSPIVDYSTLTAVKRILMISTLRVIGDVHGQVDAENLFTREALTYLDIISDAKYSVQVGDMGDAETYAQLISSVDAAPDTDSFRVIMRLMTVFHRIVSVTLGRFRWAE